MATNTLSLIGYFVLATVVAAATLAQPAPQPPSQPCPAVRDVLVTNGRIHTMDVTDTVVDVMGYQAVVWSDNERTFVLVAGDPPDQVGRLASFVRASMR